MSTKPCGAMMPGRCSPIGGRRLMVHSCTIPGLHGWKHHRCTCGHTWRDPKAPTTPTSTKRRGARRRYERKPA